MSGIRIVSDSTSDLSKELIERWNISILPLHVLMGDEEYEDGPALSPEDIFRWSDEHKTTPKTSAPSAVSAIELFRGLLSEADDIIAFSISSSMSASFSVMEMAAEELKAENRIHVIDSQNLSTGIGLQVLRAAQHAENGVPAAEIVREIKEMRARVRASFVVDTLTYLHRGGRCGGLAALAGGILKIHPRIAVADGAMHPEQKYRGRMDRVVMSYVKDMESALKNAEPDRVFITHSGCSRELLDKVRDYLVSLGIFEEILETRAAGVISSHCGPGTLGVLFTEKKSGEA
ncbi:MAG: DegV family protein [Lachnospiraceae bacterium]|nr:DegV family protein [Lachnospiraceae bacterium]